MEKTIVATGKTIDLAIEAALNQLGLDRDSVSVMVLQQAKAGFLGFGAQPAKVQVTYEAPDPVVEKVPEKPKSALGSASRSKPKAVAPVKKPEEPKVETPKAAPAPVKAEAPKAPKQEKKAEKAAAKKEYDAKRGIVEEEEPEKETLSGIADRPYCKGRAYDPNRYNTEE